MSKQPYGFNKDDLQGGIPFGYAILAVIIGAVSNRLAPTGLGKHQERASQAAAINAQPQINFELTS
jgi:hypothetical protein